jgi:hypothetical protein
MSAEKEAFQSGYWRGSPTNTGGSGTGSRLEAMAWARVSTKCSLTEAVLAIELLENDWDKWCLLCSERYCAWFELENEGSWCVYVWCCELRSEGFWCVYVWDWNVCAAGLRRQFVYVEVWRWEPEGSALTLESACGTEVEGDCFRLKCCTCEEVWPWKSEWRCIALADVVDWKRLGETQGVGLRLYNVLVKTLCAELDLKRAKMC